MHDTAMMNARNFFASYGNFFPRNKQTKVIEIGSQDVNGSLRDTCPGEFTYVGVDFVEGKGVDVVLTDPYALPFSENEADIIISSSCFEHSEMFWLVYLEVLRVLKPRGLFYLNVPSNGIFHRYPVDCWRFYPDSGAALVTWAQRNKINAALLESFISIQQSDGWNDFVAIFLKEASHAGEFPARILDTFRDYYNGRRDASPNILTPSTPSEDQYIIGQMVTTLDALKKDEAVRNKPCPCGSGKPFMHCHGI